MWTYWCQTGDIRILCVVLQPLRVFILASGRYVQDHMANSKVSFKVVQADETFLFQEEPPSRHIAQSPLSFLLERQQPWERRQIMLQLQCTSLYLHPFHQTQERTVETNFKPTLWRVKFSIQYFPGEKKRAPIYHLYSRPKSLKIEIHQTLTLHCSKLGKKQKATFPSTS